MNVFNFLFDKYVRNIVTQTWSTFKQRVPVKPLYNPIKTTIFTRPRPSYGDHGSPSPVHTTICDTLRGLSEWLFLNRKGFTDITPTTFWDQDVFEYQTFNWKILWNRGNRVPRGHTSFQLPPAIKNTKIHLPDVSSLDVI